jgi:hypothetical protein
MRKRFGLSGRATGILSAFACYLFASNPVFAVPSFAIQTDQPCSACHVSAFGPRLTQAGRDFKLYGYVANDTKQHTVPISLFGSASFTHNGADQTANTLMGYHKNDNVSLDSVDAFYAGTLWGHVGAFAEAAYDVVEESLHWEDLDIRYAGETKLFGRDAVLGVTLNNSPTVSDLWDSSPSWVFPFADSPFMPSPAAAPIIEKLPYTVLGLGGYAMLDDTVYLESDIYAGLDHGVLRALGTPLLNDTDRQSGAAVYWRALLQRDFGSGEHYAAIGTYGVWARVRPFGVANVGTDRHTDVALDATYQWVPHPERSTSDMVSLHGLYIHEQDDLEASHALIAARSSEMLSSLRLDATYAAEATYSGTIQRFQTWGSSDKAYWGTASGSPDSAGWVLELDYVPWGKPESPLMWLNGRIALQYIAYSRFDGSAADSSDNNTVLLNLKMGVALNR